MRSSVSKAVFLGRFQPMHLGHHKVIESRRERHERFLVAVGSADREREEENPLSFEERKKIIRTCFPDLEVMPVEDDERTEEGNMRWAESLEEKTGADLIITNNDLVRELVKEHTGMETEQQEIHEPGVYSGTEVRRRIRSGEEWRYLVPGCAREIMEKHLEAVRESGRDYEFKPGWKKENMQN
jgi:nicotinamide-nucleotide adenylyltransferase